MINLVITMRIIIIITTTIIIAKDITMIYNEFFRLIFFLTTPYFYLSIKYLSKFKSPNKIDVLFYYPHYYLESDSKYPSKLNLLIKSVKNNYLNYLVVEEPSIYSNSVRSKDIPFDFI